ncbi:hypothetical protein F3Y22_tig00111008pilonHSYRG00245 [Hibiscus syriacus]|uniref:SAM-dependent MTase DRM-type domain-containing protein n=1 Tax=Hibiscus syriacus TaxID=106335 RepID=A0A6A2Z811_HIBSY|nr:hypothetical protein F3Y22_tig00111008pilonHSYRG00245 [Hibiscus syriacus]
MIGSGVPTEPDQITQRTLPEDAIGSSYFYYENVALAPVNVWTGISQYLFDVEPEFVDSKHFHATTLKRGYIHNLPIENKFSLILFPPCADKGYARFLKLVMMSHLRVFRKVAFYCLGIPLKTDVKELNGDQLEQLMGRFGGFNLVVDGIQCNNLTGRNKHHHDELDDFLLVHFLAMTATTIVSSAAPKYALQYLTLPEPWKVCAICSQIQQSSEGSNGYHLNKENDRHGRGSKDVSRLEPTPECRLLIMSPASVTSSILQTFWLLGPFAFKKVKCFIIMASFILFLQQRMKEFCKVLPLSGTSSGIAVLHLRA